MNTLKCFIENGTCLKDCKEISEEEFSTKCKSCYSYCFPKLVNSFDNLISSLKDFKNSISTLAM